MTANAQPATIFNDVMGRAVDALGSERVTDLDLKRLEREAEALASVDRAGCLELKGHVAAIRGDEHGTDDYFERALRMSQDYLGTVVRYLIVLAASARTDKVGQVYERFHEIIRNEPTAVRTVSNLLSGAGWVISATELRGALQRMGLDATTIPEAEGEHVFNACRFTELSEVDISTAVGFSRRFLKDRGVKPKIVQSMVVPYENGDSAVMFQFFVDRAPDVAAQLEWELFEALDAQGFEIEKSGAIVFALSSNRRINADQHH